MTSAQSDYYALLGVSPTATQSEIKSAYRLQMKKVHPDLSHQSNEMDRITRESLAKQVNEAYSILINPELRRLYDLRMGRFPEKPKSDTSASAQSKRSNRQPRSSSSVAKKIYLPKVLQLFVRYEVAAYILAVLYGVFVPTGLNSSDPSDPVFPFLELFIEGISTQKWEMALFYGMQGAFTAISLWILIKKAQLRIPWKEYVWIVLGTYSVGVVSFALLLAGFVVWLRYPGTPTDFLAMSVGGLVMTLPGISMITTLKLSLGRHLKVT